MSRRTSVVLASLLNHVVTRVHADIATWSRRDAKTAPTHHDVRLRREAHLQLKIQPTFSLCSGIYKRKAIRALRGDLPPSRGLSKPLGFLTLEHSSLGRKKIEKKRFSLYSFLIMIATRRLQIFILTLDFNSAPT